MRVDRDRLNESVDGKIELNRKKTDKERENEMKMKSEIDMNKREKQRKCNKIG